MADDITKEMAFPYRREYMKRAEPPPQEVSDQLREAVTDYLRPSAFLRRGFYPAFEEKVPIPEDFDFFKGELPEGVEISQPTISILPAARMRRWQQILSKVEKRLGKQAMAPFQKAIVRLEKTVPEEFWNKQIEDIAHAYLRGATGTYSRKGAKGTIKLSARMAPHVPAHEVGHGLSHYLLEVSKPGSALAKVRGRWEVMREASTELESLLRRARRLRGLNNKEREALAKWKQTNYRGRSEEVFARAFSQAIEANQDFRTAAKTATRAVTANLERSERILEKANRAVREASRRASVRHDVARKVGKIEAEADDLIRWMGDPKYRKRKLIGKIGDIYSKENPTVTVGEYNEFISNLKLMDVDRLHSIWRRHSTELSKDIVKRPPTLPAKIKKAKSKIDKIIAGKGDYSKISDTELMDRIRDIRYMDDYWRKQGKPPYAPKQRYAMEDEAIRRGLIKDVSPTKKLPDVTKEMSPENQKIFNKARAKAEAQKKRNRELSKKIDKKLGELEETKKVGRKMFSPEYRYRQLSTDDVFRQLSKARKDLKTLPATVGTNRLLRLRNKILDLTDELARREGKKMKGGRLIE